jgi:hypothetical protein
MATTAEQGATKSPLYEGVGMSDLHKLISALDREDIEQARRMTGSQKLRAGGDLFDDACRWTLAGIRADHPGISDTDAMSELRRRVAMEDAEETPEAGTP